MKYLVTLIKTIEVEIEAENDYDMDNKAKLLEKDGLKVYSFENKAKFESYARGQENDV